jgi:hypothetical protein
VAAVLRRWLVRRRRRATGSLEYTTAAAFVPDYDNRQKGRPPRAVDDMSGVGPRGRGIVGLFVCAPGWGLEIRRLKAAA